MSDIHLQTNQNINYNEVKPSSNGCMSLGLFALVAIGSALGGALCLIHFAHADLLWKGGGVVSKVGGECQNNGFTVSEFWALVFSLLFLSVAGVMCFLVTKSLLQLHSSSLWLKVLGCFAIAAAYQVVAILAYNNWGYQILNCAVTGCDTDNDSTSKEEPVLGFHSTTGAIFFFLCQLFAIMHLYLIFFLCKTQKQRSNSTYSEELLPEPIDPRNEEFPHVLPDEWSDSQTREGRRLWAIIAFSFIVLLPFCLWSATTLPNTWETFTPAGIGNFLSLEAKYKEEDGCPRFSPPTPDSGIMCPERPDASMVTLDWKYKDDVILKLFPDVGIFYGFIYVISSIALLAQASPALRRLLRKRYSLGGHRYLSVGVLIAGVILFIFSFLFFYYWVHDHKYHRGEDKTATERWARTFGQMGNFFAGLLLLPAARNSLWSHVFHVPWEAAIKAHRWAGYGLLASGFCHMIGWYIEYSYKSLLPHDIFALPMYYPNNPPREPLVACADNFTIQLMTLVFWVSLIVFGVFTYETVRRKFFELFYYSHHFSIVFFAAQLLHAASAFYFLWAGLFLLTLDKLLRWWNGVHATLKPASVRVFDDIIEVALHRDQLAAPFNNQMGQYAFINIPAVSEMQWHPFTISSAPSDPFLTFHIRSQGSKTWTGALHDLSIRASSPQDIHDEIETTNQLLMTIDGPYGLPIKHQEFAQIILVAGGIGITPCHAMLRQLYALAAAGACDANVHLIWSTRAKTELDIFEGTLGLIAQDSLNDRFTFSLSVTRDESDSKDFHLVDEDHYNASHRTKFGLSYTAGRPAISVEVGEIIGDCTTQLPMSAQEIIVFTCGPPEMVQECSQVAHIWGTAFHAESFAL